MKLPRNFLKNLNGMINGLEQLSKPADIAKASIAATIAEAPDYTGMIADLNQLQAIHQRCSDLIQTHLVKFNPDL